MHPLKTGSVINAAGKNSSLSPDFSKTIEPINPMSISPISPELIAHAHPLIATEFLHTPQFELDTLNRHLNTRLVLKVETLNPIRSFKGRGTDYFVKQHLETTAFICASAGNFGQGMAYACRQQGIPLTVFAAETANPFKLERMQQLGATVELMGRDFDAAKAAAKAAATTRQQTFVEDGHDVDITIGAGTIGLELSQYPEPLDGVLVPLGNGALINGIGTWFKAHHPTTHMIGVVAAGAPAMDLSWRQGQRVTTESVDTIADGIGVRNPVPAALQTMTTTVDDIVQVSDTAILAAMQLAYTLLGIVVEPAGAVGLAAALVYPDRFADRRLATPLCGSNVTEAQLQAWLSRSPQPC